MATAAPLTTRRTPTRGQPPAELSAACHRRKVLGGKTIIGGRLDSTPSTRKKTFTIQFFSNPQNDPSSFEEGRTFLGQKKVTTNRQGKAFSFQTGKPVALGDRITATATGKGGTSEFSDPVPVDLTPGQG